MYKQTSPWNSLKLLFCSLVIIFCNTAPNSVQKKKFENETRIRRDQRFEGQSGRLYKINLNEVCDGRDFILLGACSSVYIRCSYDLSSSFPRAVIEKCANRMIFNATVCDAISDKCLAVFARQTQQINAEIEMILEEITFCKDGPGIYLFLDGICSRQAYICQDYKQGFVFACPAEMIMKVRPFGCFTSTHECNSAEILTKTLTSLRQYAIQEYCQHSLTAVYSYDVLGFPRILCRTWYIRCNEFIQDIIYCEDGLIYDAKLRECRERSVNDLCIMPNICKNRQGQAVSLNNCERHFVHCDGEFTPKEFVCAEGFVFSNGRCLPSELEIGYDCWQCQNGMQQQSSFHRCNQYSMCINGHWMDRECPPGMSYSAKSQVCRLDPSCAHPSKCKLDVSYNLKCDEYMICSWKNIFEHHFCPTFHRWDSEALRCIPDSNCVPSMARSCKENDIIASSDCQSYQQCKNGRWRKMLCTTYSSARFCEKCILSQLRPDRITHVEKQCIDGDTSNDEENCAHYAICIDGKWKKAKCKLREMFWNQQLKRCDYSNQCKAYKQADCSHGQRLIGGVCGEYLECIHGSWILMKCLQGFTFDRNVQKCVSSHNCASFHDTHLSTIDYNISMSPLSHLLTTFENDQQNLHKMTTSSSYEQPKQYCVVGSKIRDEYNCSRYFICTKNGYKVRYCKDGQKFNEESGQCDKNYHYDLSHCDDGKTLESKLCGHYQFCQDGIWHEGKCQDNRQFANGRCQEYSSEKRNLSTCQNGDVSVNNSDLMRYFKCINGRFREQFCENGTIFDAERGFCSKCTNCTSEKRCKEKETKASYGVSAAYYMCENGKFRSRFCPYGFVYNHDNRACLQYTATSMFEQTCKETGDSAGYRADPLDCHQFYQCANGKWVSKTCPAHLFWNPEKTICDWPDQVDLCTQRET